MVCLSSKYLHLNIHLKTFAQEGNITLYLIA